MLFANKVFPIMLALEILLENNGSVSCCILGHDTLKTSKTPFVLMQIGTTHIPLTWLHKLKKRLRSAIN